MLFFKKCVNKCKKEDIYADKTGSNYCKKCGIKVTNFSFAYGKEWRIFNLSESKKKNRVSVFKKLDSFSSRL